jgi:4,5-DOPA dioxygenase extradiol
MTPATPAPTALDALSDLPATPRLPVLFVGHGSPMNAITDNPWRQAWQALGPQLLARHGRPALILCVSAHWLTRGWWLTAMDDPRTIHDFGGFPQALFDQRYPAPGAPRAAAAVSRAVAQPGSGAPLGLDDLEWGLDHGTWSVLKPMFPAADIPVVQLSLDDSRPPAEHLQLGQRLRALRERGVLIVGSGNVVHNLRAVARNAPDHRSFDWAVEFDAFAAHQIASGQTQTLADFLALGPVARLAHPTHDHFLPLLVAAGATWPGEPQRFFNTGFQMASIGMRSVVWGFA